jgi:hypothetical protein
MISRVIDVALIMRPCVTHNEPYMSDQVNEENDVGLSWTLAKNEEMKVHRPTKFSLEYLKGRKSEWDDDIKMDLNESKV